MTFPAPPPARRARLALAAGGLALALASAAAATPASPSAEVAQVSAWVRGSGDNRGLPFVIVDKRQARVFVFDGQGRPRASTAALLGLAHGDDSAPGIGHRRLADIGPAERTTPAGRFVAALGPDLGERNVLWVDYEAAISLHRVVPGRPAERRAARLASPTADDNRISYGCINVPAAFFDTHIEPAFKGVGIVYILPETRPLATAFPALAAK